MPVSTDWFFIIFQVDIEINGEPVDIQMKLGESGEAFFVEEHDDVEQVGTGLQNPDAIVKTHSIYVGLLTKYNWLDRFMKG